jgi:dihydrofolate synthase/folylpolyglutamate synthase
LIRPELTHQKPERSLRKWQARQREMASFLAACGDPQRSFPAIHVTGTSGKGSVSTMIAAALQGAGYRVGLHTSPYLQSPTEKNWIDGELLSPELFAELVDWVWPVAWPRRRPETPASIHGMASVALAFEAFRRSQVEVAVIEAGCGGRFDLTNCLQSIGVVITTVGLDHVLSLGPTVTDIAWHKAGIIQPGVPAVTGAQGTSLEVIRTEAKTLGAPLVEVQPPPGPFWEFNACLAQTLLKQLEPHFHVAQTVLDGAAMEARLPARREVMPEPGRQVILDGAHNPDKMAALCRTVEPGSLFVVGCLSAKELTGLVQALQPVAAGVVATEPEVYAKPACSAEELAQCCRAVGLPVRVQQEPAQALKEALAWARPDQWIVGTGSLYLVGQLRERWYPTDQVILQQTSWPDGAKIVA